MADMATVPMPANLVAACRRNGREAWLAGLPAQIEGVAARWSLFLEDPFEPGGQTAWVAPARSPGHGDAVLKVAWRHMESEDEAAGLREWAGEGAIRVFGEERLSDRTTALLLERCRPGTTLAQRPEDEQDVVIASLLHRLWRAPSDGSTFRPLQQMCDYWAGSFEREVARGESGVDLGMAREGASLFRSLPASAPDEVLLCTDLHAENVLSAAREEWLVIDPKPFVGDRTYDALQHLLNCGERLEADPRGLAARVAGLLGLDPERLLLWLFARLVVDPANWPWAAQVARRIRP
jgi:streptomycin 6-kinase